MVRKSTSTLGPFWSQWIHSQSFNLDLSVNLIRNRVVLHASTVGGFSIFWNSSVFWVTEVLGIMESTGWKISWLVGNSSLTKAHRRINNGSPFPMPRFVAIYNADRVVKKSKDVPDLAAGRCEPLIVLFVASWMCFLWGETSNKVVYLAVLTCLG